MNKAFTLVEVTVAGSLIGLCVLTAVSIIPQGLQATNEARMRAVAAAAIMTLSAKGGGLGCMNGSNVSSFLATLKYESSGAVTTAPTMLYNIPTSPGQGDLERRLIFSYTDGNNGAGQNTRAIVAWLLNADPDNSPKKARYLATFTELR